jgi:hypothetical protein
MRINLDWPDCCTWTWNRAYSGYCVLVRDVAILPMSKPSAHPTRRGTCEVDRTAIFQRFFVTLLVSGKNKCWIFSVIFRAPCLAMLTIVYNYSTGYYWIYFIVFFIIIYFIINVGLHKLQELLNLSTVYQSKIIGPWNSDSTQTRWARYGKPH